jgi:PIN domain nuclease of toxin-antitoxin system
MTTKHVVDTHALVWFLEGNPRLGVNARAVLENRESELVVPVIVLAEACWMIEHGRTSIPTVGEFLATVDADPRIVVVPLDRVVQHRTVTFTAIAEMHDRQIVATARLLMDQGHAVAVLTKDTNIRNSGLVPTVW